MLFRSLVIVGPAGHLSDVFSLDPCARHSRAVPRPKSVSIQPRLVFPGAGNVEVLKASSGISVPEVHIAPLDRIKVPPELDGHTCSSRWPHLNSIETKTDVEAVKRWLHKYEGSPITLRSYRQAAERLLNWAVAERHKPLSSLDDSDLIAFEEFIANPQPRERWICVRGTARSDPNWTPMVGQIGRASCRERVLKDV